MPTYEYYCEANDQTVEVMHSMSETLATWGELCACAGIDLQSTSEDAVVQKKLSAISLLKKKVAAMVGGGGGCCGGGGCGCGGN
jgi:predicted nucleic acid-binding Zn ribbon protein